MGNSYEVAYELSGFKRLVRENVAVEAAAPRSVTDRLELGELSATVNVTEGAQLVTPETSTTFRQVSGAELVAVPTSTRSFTQLLSTEAGVNTELSHGFFNKEGLDKPEARYVGTRGRNLLQAVAFNQGYDLNALSTPDHIYERFNQAYLAAGAPNGPLKTAATARERGMGRAFGFPNPYRVGLSATCAGGILGLPAGTPTDLNLSNPLTCAGSTLGGGNVINFEARVPILGFNVPEAPQETQNGSRCYWSTA